MVTVANPSSGITCLFVPGQVGRKTLIRSPTLKPMPLCYLAVAVQSGTGFSSCRTLSSNSLFFNSKCCSCIVSSRILSSISFL